MKRDGLYYEKSSDVPFTGKTTGDEQGTFKNGKKHGHWFVWDNGQLDTAGTYKDGEKDGPQVTFYSNGQLESKGTCKNGEKDGPWFAFKEDGTVWDYGSVTYKDGLKIK